MKIHTHLVDRLSNSCLNYQTFAALRAYAKRLGPEDINEAIASVRVRPVYCLFVKACLDMCVWYPCKKGLTSSTADAMYQRLKVCVFSQTMSWKLSRWHTSAHTLFSLYVLCATFSQAARCYRSIESPCTHHLLLGHQLLSPKS